MITSIVGRLIKKPELVERINIPGKRVVNFTVVQNNTHGGAALVAAAMGLLGIDEVKGDLIGS